MRRLYQFILNNRAFFIFVLLELLCYLIIVRNNTYHGSAFFNFSNATTAELKEATSNVKDYFVLRKQNEKIMRENAMLKKELVEYMEKEHIYRLNLVRDEKIRQFKFIPAKVVGNTIHLENNYVTIDKGTEDGIHPGMGIISANGVVGKVKSSSENFAVVQSLLHSDASISSQFQRNKVLGTTSWDGKNHAEASLEYIPRHHTIREGDTIVTSGYNAVFPEDIKIGYVKSAELSEYETFYDIKLDLSVDFSRLYYVYAVKNKLRSEKDSLEGATIDQDGQ